MEAGILNRKKQEEYYKSLSSLFLSGAAMHFPHEKRQKVSTAAVPSRTGNQRLEELDLVVAGWSGSVRALLTARTVQPELFHTRYA